jgi:predicted dehydrogenase
MVWRVAGINFDHMHMPDLLQHVATHPNAEIVGICHENKSRMAETSQRFSIPDERIFDDVEQCLDQSKPHIVILCPATGRHAEYTEQVVAHGNGYHIIMEKPFADTLANADQMIAAVEKTGKRLAINWPLAWYPVHVTSKRLIDEGVIGEVIEVHYYDGNKADGFVGENAWFLKKAAGGGSLLDYLGYGATLATWFQGNRIPLEVMAMDYVPEGWEVDNHSITLVRYAHGLSKLETRWGTFTSPWIMQPQPKCGFVIVGSKGTIASYDYETTIRVQTEVKPEGYTVPVDVAQAPMQDCVQYVIHCIENDLPIEGPLSPITSRIGQQIVDGAVRSVQEKRAIAIF